MEKVVRMDRELSKHGRCEVTTEEAMVALKKAYKWAQMGMVVSTAPPVETTSSDSNSAPDKKKTAAEVTCKEKNAELARWVCGSDVELKVGGENVIMIIVNLHNNKFTSTRNSYFYLCMHLLLMLISFF